jgi:hypothetical protein
MRVDEVQLWRDEVERIREQMRLDRWRIRKNKARLVVAQQEMVRAMRGSLPQQKCEQRPMGGFVGVSSALRG